MAQFQVHARVLDLLGEEQIADLPTAVSELFKNAYDAYASEAILDIYMDDGHAVFWDDGFGMSEFDVLERWLVVGTPGKRLSPPSPPAGKARRDLMGEKGIGRLAISRLGSTLLLVTRKPVDDWAATEEQQQGKGPFTALFLHWAIAQNRRLHLADIEVPTVNFESLDELDGRIVQDMIDSFVRSVEHPEKPRLWEGSEVQELRKRIIDDCRAFRPDMTKLRRSALARKPAGTAFFIGNLHSDLAIYTTGNRLSERSHEADEMLTLLGNYADRFTVQDHDLSGVVSNQAVGTVRGGAAPFSVDVRRWRPGDPAPRSIFEEAEIFSVADLDAYDHRFEISFDEYGRYSGLIERFGEAINVEPAPLRPGSRPLVCGPFTLHLWYWQGNPKESSLAPEVYARRIEQLERFGGLMIYRSGLRVLPYGNVSFDWLKFEERRSRWAGRYMFSHRRMFGFVSIDAKHNPQLIDKAGREGLINNAAYREFRQALTDFFIDIAAKHFFRNEGLERQIDKLKERAGALDAAQRRVDARREAVRFAAERAIEVAARVPQDMEQLLADAAELQRGEAAEIAVGSILDRFEDESRKVRNALVLPPTDGLNLTGRHRSLTSLLARHAEVATTATQHIASTRQRLVEQLSARWPGAEQRWRQRSLIDQKAKLARMSLGAAYAGAAQQLTAATAGLSNWVDGRKQADLTELGHRLDAHLKRIEQAGDQPISALDLAESLEDISQTAARLEQDAEQLGARLATHIKGFYLVEAGQAHALQGDQVTRLAEGELERMGEELHDTLLLAQAGLAAEIADHDLGQTYHGIKGALQVLAIMVRRADRALEQVKLLQELFDHMELLYRQIQPLYRTRGQRPRWISGDDVAFFVRSLMAHLLQANNVRLDFTPAFRTFRVFESTALLLPAYINIVDNAVYWLAKAPRKLIRFDVIDGVVAISDTGPGIDVALREVIFERFFSTKPRGRGLGLYVSRQVLRSAGHDLWATAEPPYATLDGACFCIRFADRALSEESSNA